MIKVQTEQKNERVKVKINVMEGTVDDMANELGSIVGAVTKEIYQLTDLSGEMLKDVILEGCNEAIDEALGKESKLFISKSDSIKAFIKGDIDLNKFLNLWGL